MYNVVANIMHPSSHTKARGKGLIFVHIRYSPPLTCACYFPGMNRWNRCITPTSPACTVVVIFSLCLVGDIDYRVHMYWSTSTSLLEKGLLSYHFYSGGHSISTLGVLAMHVQKGGGIRTSILKYLGVTALIYFCKSLDWYLYLYYTHSKTKTSIHKLLVTNLAR